MLLVQNYGVDDLKICILVSSDVPEYLSMVLVGYWIKLRCAIEDHYFRELLTRTRDNVNIQKRLASDSYPLP